MISILSLLLLTNSNSMAQDICNTQNNITEERVIMPMEPEYFFKPIPLEGENDPRREVSVIMNNSNWTIDMKDPSKVVQIPGPYDGVPSPDGRFLAMPANGGGLVFYDRNNMNRENPKELLNDVENGSNMLEGVYHSIGMLNKSANGNATYRLITDQLTSSGKRQMSHLYYKDYNTTTTPEGINFAQNEHPSKPLCSNMLDRYFKLPMISKDGRQLAAYDVESGTTKIFSIDQNNGNSVCNLTRDLGFAAGKVEFSPDGKKITFAMDSHPTDPSSVEWYAQPPETKNYNVYVADLENETMSRVSLNNKGNSYYPSFWHDGSVIYLNQELGENENEYSLVRARFKNAPTIPFPRLGNLECSGLSPDFLALTALGSLWSDLCLSLDKPVTIMGLAMQPLALDKQNCRKMVEENWNRFKSARENQTLLSRVQTDRQGANTVEMKEKLYKAYLGLSINDLLSACPSYDQGKGGSTLSASKVDTKIDPNENPMTLCQQCHTAAAGSRAYDFSNPTSLAPYKAKMLTHVMTGFMPRNTPISQERRDRILDWIETNIPGKAVLPDYEDDSN